VPHENHQRFVAAGIAGLRKWQQLARARNLARHQRNKKGRREAGLSRIPAYAEIDLNT
jgi:hypothetical protein